MPVEPPEFPLSGAALYFQSSANYVAIESWEMHLTLSLKKSFTFQSLTFYFTSSLLRAWMTHLEVKKYLNCLKYWCYKCHNLEEEAWKLAFKLCLQRFHVFLYRMRLALGVKLWCWIPSSPLAAWQQAGERLMKSPQRGAWGSYSLCSPGPPGALAYEFYRLIFFLNTHLKRCLSFFFFKFVQRLFGWAEVLYSIYDNT